MWSMDIGEMVKDALKYPLSNWKKILILGVIILISGIASIAMSLGTTNSYVIFLLIGIGFIIGLLVNGYMFRIVQSSLDGKMELPEFKNWVNIGINGFKVFIVFIIYLFIPPIAILFLLSLFFESDFTVLGSMFLSVLGSMGPTPLDSFVNLIGSIIWSGTLNFAIILYNLFGSVIPFIYIILIIPLFLVAIANMAYYEGEFKSAFRFREILDEIRSIGWFNLIKWYAATGILFLALFVMGNVIAYIFSLIHVNIINIIVGLLLSLTLIPYLYIYIARSLALYYIPD
jgi:hypothetical protein